MDSVQGLRLVLTTLAAVAVAAGLLLAEATTASALTAGSRVPWAGEDRYLLGVNYPWYIYGNDFGSNAWGAYGIHSADTFAAVDADFAEMAAAGVHTVRWWLFADGRAGVHFDASGLPTGIDHFVYADLDAALEITARHHLNLNLVLLDFSWMSDAQMVNGVQQGGHAKVINTAIGQQALLDNVFVPVFHRYGHHPRVLSWEVMNEPEWAISDDEAVNQHVSEPSTLVNFLSFTRRVADAVHANTASYVTVGGAAMKWAGQWVGQGLDYYQIHYYDWMRSSKSTNLFGATYRSLNLDRPVVVGEFPASSAVSLNQYLDFWLSSGYAGAWVWSFRGRDSVGAPDTEVLTAWAATHAGEMRTISPTPSPPPEAPAGSPAAENPPASGQPTAFPQAAIPGGIPAAHGAQTGGLAVLLLVLIACPLLASGLIWASGRPGDPAAAKASLAWPPY